MATELERLADGRVVYLMEDGSQVTIDPKRLKQVSAAQKSAAASGQELKTADVPKQPRNASQETMSALAGGSQDLSAAPVPPRVAGAMIGGVSGLPGGLPGVALGAASGAAFPPQETAGGVGAEMGGAGTQALMNLVTGGKGGLANAGLRAAGQGLGVFAGMTAEGKIRKSLGAELPTPSGESMWIVPALAFGLAGAAEGGAGLIQALSKMGNDTAVARAVNRLEGAAGVARGDAVGDFSSRIGSRFLSRFIGTEQTAGAASKTGINMFESLAPIKLPGEQISEIGAQLQSTVKKMGASLDKAKAAGTTIPNADEITILRRMNFKPEDPQSVLKAIFGQNEDDQIRTISAMRTVFATSDDTSFVDALADEWLWQTVINPATKSSSTLKQGAILGARPSGEEVSYLAGKDLMNRVNQLGSKIDEVFGPGRAQGIRDVATAMELMTEGAQAYGGQEAARSMTYLSRKMLFASAATSGGVGAGAYALGASGLSAIGIGATIIPLALVLQHTMTDPRAAKQLLEFARNANPAALQAFTRSLAAGTATTEDSPPVARSGR